MTTILIDSKVGFIAADRRHTDNEYTTILSGAVKIKTARIGGHTHYMASSGHESTGAIMEDWYAHGEWDADPMDIDEGFESTTLVLTHDGRILEIDRYLRPQEIPHRFAATGSGGLIARSVLEAGCGVLKAMRTAIKLDNGSGYPFDVFYLSGEHEVYER